MAERVRLITYVAVPDGVPDEDPDGTWLVDGVVEPEELDEPVFVGRELIVGVLLVVAVAVGVPDDVSVGDLLCEKLAGRVCVGVAVVLNEAVVDDDTVELVVHDCEEVLAPVPDEVGVCDLDRDALALGCTIVVESTL